MAISGKVRGITIELGADTSKLVKDLKAANSTISHTQKELRDVDKLLKFNPGNITLIKQRTQALQQQISNTKNKLDELKKAEATMKSKGVDENSEQFRALQREIIETESKLKTLSSTAGSGSATLYAISEKTGKIGEAATNAGRSLLPLTAGIAAVGTASVKTAADFDTQMSKVAAISGAIGSDFDALRNKAREMGSSTKFSASEAGQAFEYMALAGWKTEDMLNGVEGIMNLAAASGEDLATTSDIVTDALTAFGMEAKDSGKFADVLAAASANANTNVAMLGESFKYVAPVAGALGYSVEDTTAALGLMANSGIKASQAGTTLRTLFTNMSKPTKAMSDAMKTLGVRLDDGKGNMLSFREVMLQLREGFGTLKISQEDFQKQMQLLEESFESGEISQSEYDKATQELAKSAFGAEGALKAEAAASLAGSRGMSGLLAIVNASEKDFNALTGAIDKSSGTSKKMADTMQDNLAGQFTILKSQLQELAISFGDVLMPTLRKVVEKIQNFIDKFNGMSDGSKKMIAVVASIAAAIGPALLAFGKMAKAISAITRVMSTLKFTSLLTNPVTLAIGAVAGLVAGFKILNDKLYESTNSLSHYKDDLDEISKTNDDLTSSIKASKEELEKKITASEAEANAAELMMNKLNELMGVEDKSAQQKGEIKAIVDKLNELVPELGLAYEEEADKLNKSNAEIKRNIDLRKQQAQADAYMTVYQESLTKAAEAELNAARAQDTLNKMLAESSPELKELYDYVNQYGEGIARNSNKITTSGKSMASVLLENEAALDELIRAQEEITEAQELHTSELERSEVALNKFNDVNTELAVTQKEVARQINKTNLKAFREELGKTFGKDLPAALNKALNDAQSYGVEIPEELKEGILLGSKDVNVAIGEINKLVDGKLKESTQSARSSGQKIDSEVATGVSENKGAVKSAIDSLNNSVNFQRAVAKAKSQGVQIPAGLKEAVASGKLSVDQAVKKVNDAVNFANAKQKATNDGKAVSTNFAKSIEANKGAAEVSGKNLANKANNAISANNKGYANGQAFGNKFRDGISNKNADVYAKGKDLANKANNAVTNNNGGYSRGQAFGNRFKDGISNKNAEVYAKGKDLANKANNAVTNNNGGFSRGKAFGDKYQEGISDRNAAVYERSKQLAQKAYNAASNNNRGYSAGREYGQGYAEGISAELDSVGARAEQLALRARNATRAAQNSGSPSKVAMGLGHDFGEGYEIGISDMFKAVFNRAAGLAKEAISGANGNYSALTYNRPSAIAATNGVGGMVTNNYTQNNYSPAALSAADIYRQTNNLINLKGAYT